MCSSYWNKMVLCLNCKVLVKVRMLAVQLFFWELIYLFDVIGHFFKNQNKHGELHNSCISTCCTNYKYNYMVTHAI